MSAETFAALGSHLLATGDVAAALAQLQIAFALQPTKDTGKALATAFIKSNRYKEAARVLDELLVGTPDDVTMLCVRGELAMAVLEFPFALDTFKRCLALDPKSEHPHGVRARIMIRQMQRTLEARIAG